VYAGDTITANLALLECYRRHLTSSRSSSFPTAGQSNSTDAIATTDYKPSDAVLSVYLTISSIATADCKYTLSSDSILGARLYPSTTAAVTADCKHSLVYFRLNTTAVAECQLSRSPGAVLVVVELSLNTTMAAAASEYYQPSDSVLRIEPRTRTTSNIESKPSSTA